MKIKNKKSVLIFLLLAGGMVTIQAQTDVTAEYIVNPSFEYSAEGVAYTAETALSFGEEFYGWTAPTLVSNGWVNIDITPTASNSGYGKAVTASDGSYFFYNRQGWGDATGSLSQTISSLPAGKYYLKVDYKAAGKTANTKLGIKATFGGSELVNVSSFVSVADPGDTYFNTQAWKQMGVWFTVSTEGEVLIEITEELNGSGQRADICLDNVRLYKWDTDDAVNYANASASSPMDVTAAFVTNPYFDSDVSGWTSTTGYQNKARATNQNGAFSGGFYENWNGSANTSGKMSYTIASGLPDGYYRLTMAAWGNNANGTGLNMFAGSSKVAVTSSTPSFYVIETEVNGGSLEFGLELSSGNPSNWIGLDNVKLEYMGDPVAAALEILEEVLATANPLVGQSMGATESSALNTAITEAQNVYNDENHTQETISDATAKLREAISAAQSSIALYEQNATSIAAMYELMNSTNVYTVDAYSAYKAKADDYQAKWEAGTLTETVENPSSLRGWHAANEYDDFLLSAWTIGGEQCANFDKGLYINTWSTEGLNDGSDFLVPFFEYYADNVKLGTNTIQATVTGLTANGNYKVTAWTRVRIVSGGGDPTGITLAVGSGVAVDVTEGSAVSNDARLTHAIYTAYGKADSDGNLTITYTVAEDNNIHWLSFRDVKYEEVAKTAEQLAMEDALATAQLVDQTKLAPAVQTMFTEAFAAAESANDEDSWKAATLALQAATQAASTTEEPYALLKELIAHCEEDQTNSVATEGDAQTFETAVESAKNTADTANTADALTTAYTTLNAAHQTYVKVAYPNAGQSFDMTFMMKNPVVTSAEGWTNGNIASGQQYTGAPDNTYLDNYQTTRDMHQIISDAPEGLYTLKAATRAYSGMTTNYIYIQNGEDKKTAMTHNVGNSGNTLGNGWDWTTTEAINVVSGNLTVGFYSSCGTSQWAGADNFTLTRTYDVSTVQSSVAALVAKAETAKKAPMGASEIAALDAAIDGADATSISPFELKEDIAALNEAIDAAAAWLVAYNEAKKPLVAALERFESDYNDGANGALHPMSTEAWNTLLARVQVAAEAKDVTDGYDGFGSAAEALSGEFTKADASIALYAPYAVLVSGLPIIDASYFNTVIAEVNTAEYQATDAKVTEAVGKLAATLEAYASTQDGDFDISSILGANLDFETAQGGLSNVSYPNVYEQPEWTNTFNSQYGGDNNQYINRKARATDRTDEAKTSNVLYMRGKWQDVQAVMQIKKTTVLPAGNYTISFYMKQTQTAGMNENLNYYAINGVRTTFSASASWEKKSYSFELTEASTVDLSFGFVGGQGGNDVDVFVDDITLTCNTETAYRRALAAAQAQTSSLAVQAALAEFTYTEEEEKAKTEEEITLAVNVLNNAVAIAGNSESATSLWKNADFRGATVQYSTTNNGVYAPADWNFSYTFEGWHDTFVRDGVLNVYGGNPTKYAELKQSVANLPNGTYKLSADIKTFDDYVIEGESMVALYGAPSGGNVGRSVNVSNSADEFANYEVYVKVTNHELTAGFRTDKGYFQTKNFQVEFVADNEAGVDNGRLYQEAFVKANNLELDVTALTHAQGTKVYLNKANAIIYAAEGAVANAKNVVEDGTCANLVLTDGEEVGITQEFTATSASYKRSMANNWGTIILPYAVASNENVTFYELTAVEEGTEGVMTFTSVETLEANKPGAFKKADANATDVTFAAENVAVGKTEKVGVETKVAGWNMNGTYSTENINVAEQADAYYYISNNKFWNAAGSLAVNPFRAYFTAGTTVESNFRIFIEDGTTGIGENAAGGTGLSVFGEKGCITLVAGTEVDYVVYTLNAQPVANGRLGAGEVKTVHVPAGIYVVNGAKVIVK